MRVLTNLPLECFEARGSAGWSGIEVVSYGPAHRMVVDGRHWPFDVSFDASTGSVESLWRRLPSGFAPDLLLIWWPDQEPLPDGLWRSPVPVVGVMSDYNLTLPAVAQLAPLFDLWLCDRPGVALFERLGFEVRPFVQYSYKVGHHGDPHATRPVDVAFAGNLNPVVQRARMPWIERVARLADRGLDVRVRGDAFGDAYRALLGTAKIGFNRSIRSELNLRAFEIPACGALALLEHDNVEVREVFEPGEEIVLYGGSHGELEDVVERYLRDERERLRIAANGQRRVHEFSMGRRVAALLDLVADEAPAIRAARTRHASTAPAERALARGTAMLGTWARPEHGIAPLLDAARLTPDDARVWNALACARLAADRDGGGPASALELLRRSAACDPTYVPAVANLATLLAGAGLRDESERIAREYLAPRLAALGRRVDEADDDRTIHRPGVAELRHALAGPWLPAGFGEFTIGCAHGLAAALRTADVAPLATHLHTAFGLEPSTERAASRHADRRQPTPAP